MRVRLEWFFPAAIASMLTSCQPQAPLPPPSLPLAGQTVEILVPADLALSEMWEPLLQEWHAETGGDVQWSDYDPATSPWKVGTPGEPPNGGRVILFPLAELSDVDASGFIQPFPSEVSDTIDGKDIFPGLKEAILSRQRKLVAAPVSAPVMLCYYRKDLLEASGRTLPQTWDDYQRLIDELDAWAPGFTVLEPCGPAFRASLFLSRSAACCKHPQNYSVWFDMQTGEPLFDSPGFVRALDMARQAWSKMPDTIWSMTPADCRQAIFTGQAALVLACEPPACYPRFGSLAEETSTIPEQVSAPLSIGVVRLPGSLSVYHRDAKRWDTLSEDAVNQPGFSGFSGLALGAAAGDSRAAAWHLLHLLTKRQDQAFAGRPRSPCRESDMLSPWNEDDTVSPETASLIADATAETLRRRGVVCDLAVPRANDIRTILSEELTAAKDNSRTTQEILAAMQERISTATKDDRAPLRDSYRRSLGLPALK